jgi:hypothetical protein
MAILSLDFFGSDLSKMDQTRKFGEQTSRILEFKPKGLDFEYIYQLINQKLNKNFIINNAFDFFFQKSFVKDFYLMVEKL